MMAHLKYLRYVLRHKWFVFKEACRLGIPWLGLIHDLSKFRPSEWGPYVEYFYGNERIKRETVFRNGGNSAVAWWVDRGQAWEEDRRADFDVAWNHHQKRGKHHWQYWVLAADDGPVYPLPMPDKYRREMLADWMGAGQAVGKPDTRVWYLKQKARGRQMLHSETRIWVEAQLGVIE